MERPFRTVKEAHETLYHFHTPQDEAEANLWLRHYLARYNAQPHRSGRHSRAEDWSANLPEPGIRAMCAWDRFCAFAREPERRRVGVDARVQVDGVAYEVEPSLAGETVTLWWGLIVSKAVSIEKSRITMNTLVTALFCDLSPDKKLTIPKNTELRDRTLADLVRKRRKPIVLIVDEAHDLRQDTLTGLKRLTEMAATERASCPCCWPAIPSCAATCAARRWRRSATAPRCSPWRA